MMDVVPKGKLVTVMGRITTIHLKSTISVLRIPGVPELVNNIPKEKIHKLTTFTLGTRTSTAKLVIEVVVLVVIVVGLITSCCHLCRCKKISVPRFSRTNYTKETIQFFPPPQSQPTV